MDARPTRLAVALLAAVALVVSACSGTQTTGTPAASTSAATQTGAAKVTIKIGLSGSFSGVSAFYGQNAQKGAELAVDELNASDKKFTYVLTTADDACTAQGGAQAFNSLIDVQSVDVILGSPCSAATLGGMVVLSQSKTPALTVGSTNPTISQQSGVGGNPYMWRMNLDDSIMATYYAKYIAAQGVKNIAIIMVNSDFGIAAGTAYESEFSKNGITVVDKEVFTQGGGDFRAQLTKMGAANPAAMLFIGAHGDSAVLLKQKKELGLSFRVFSTGDTVSKAFQSVAGDVHLGDGVVEASNWDATYTVVADFVSKYRAKYNNEDPQSYAGQAYYGVLAIAQAANLGGPGRAGIQSGFPKLDYQAPLGLVKFDDHNQAHGTEFIVGYVNGQIKLIDQVKGG